MKKHAWFHLFDQEYCTQLYMYNYEYVNYEDLTLIPVAWIPLPASWTAKAEGWWISQWSHMYQNLPKRIKIQPGIAICFNGGPLSYLNPDTSFAVSIKFLSCRFINRASMSLDSLQEIHLSGSIKTNCIWQSVWFCPGQFDKRRRHFRRFWALYSLFSSSNNASIWLPIVVVSFSSDYQLYKFHAKLKQPVYETNPLIIPNLLMSDCNNNRIACSVIKCIFTKRQHVNCY